MYAEGNPKTKKALRDRVAAYLNDDGADSGPVGPAVYAFQPGPFGPDVTNGWHCCEGPHYPAPHRWYAQVRVVSGIIVEVKK